MASHNPPQAVSSSGLHPEPQRRLFLMAINRTRNKAVTLRMTADELTLFQKQFKKSKAKNQTDFILALLRDKPIVINNDFTAILAELKRQGNNLYQIARRLNEGTPFDKEGKKVLNECWKMYHSLLGKRGDDDECHYSKDKDVKAHQHKPFNISPLRRKRNM